MELKEVWTLFISTGYNKDFLYKHGLPFSPSLAENLDDCITRVQRKKPVLIVIDGGLGEGKTTLLIHCINYINMKLGFPMADLEKRRQLAMGGLEFVQKIRECYEEKLPCVGYDEAGDFNKRGSLTAFNSMLNRTFETFRAFNCIVIMTLPAMNVLDQDVFDKKIPRLNINCKGRTTKSGNYACYSLYRMLLLRQRMLKLGQLKQYAYTSVTSNCDGHFKNLPPELEATLNRVSTESKLAILQKSEVKLEGLLTFPEIAVRCQRSIAWVRITITNLKLKPVRIIKKVKYFNADTLNVLSEHLDAMNENPSKRGRPRTV